MEERIKILKMVEDGRISADEAEKLLSALEDGEFNGIMRKGRARWLKVRVYERDSDKPKVKVNVPLALLKIGAKMGAKFNIAFPEEAKRTMHEKGVDLSDLKDLKKIEEVIDSLASHGPFKLVDVEEEKEKVEVYIE
jgi:hypothetical protein